MVVVSNGVSRIFQLGGVVEVRGQSPQPPEAKGEANPPALGDFSIKITRFYACLPKFCSIRINVTKYDVTNGGS